MGLTETFENVKDTLKLGPKNLVGLDIGLSAVKLAELRKVGKSSFKLVSYASVPLPEGTLIDDEINKEEEIIDAIKKALKKGKFSVKQVSIGLFGNNTVARKLTLAGGSDDEVEDQILWEAEQYLPFPVEDALIGHHTFGENEAGGVNVLLAAAKNELVSHWKDMVDSAGAKVKIIDLQTLALINVFEFCQPQYANDPEGSYIILNIGAQKTEFIIYKKGMIQFIKEIPVGGLIVTEEIQRQMGVNYLEAEDLKCVGDENGNLPEEILNIVSEVLETFFDEYKKAIEFYITSTSDDSLRSCLVTGGGALTVGLIDGLEELFGLEVQVLNPFERIDFDRKKFSDADLNEMALKGAVAIGLGMREIK